MFSDQSSRAASRCKVPPEVVASSYGFRVSTVLSVGGWISLPVLTNPVFEVVQAVTIYHIMWLTVPGSLFLIGKKFSGINVLKGFNRSIISSLFLFLCLSSQSKNSRGLAFVNP